MRYRVSYSTFDWSQCVQILILADESDPFLFCVDQVSFELTLQFHEETAPQGSMDTNLAHCRITKHQYSTEIGSLQGIPWEETRLPKDLIEVPRELELHYPNGQIVLLSRIETEILKHALHDIKTLEKAFVYDPIQHSVLIPAAFQLIQQYQGGVSLHIGPHVRFPHQDWIDSKAKLVSSGFGGKIERIVPTFFDSPRVPHESPRDFLNRFYSMTKRAMSLSSNNLIQHLSWKDIELDLFGSSPWIQHLESVADDSARSVTFFVLDHTGLESTKRPVLPKVFASLEERIRQVLPIDYQWKILPFHRIPIEVSVEIDIHCNADRFVRLRKTAIEDAISSQLRKTSPLQTHTFDYDQALRNLPNSSVFPSHQEFRKLKTSFLAFQTGEILEAKERPLGHVYDPIPKVKLNLQTVERPDQ
jgi:hypothetical protein